MTSALAQGVLALYYLVLGLLALFGVHRLILVALYYRTRRAAPPAPPLPAEWPRVTVQLPLFNELYVASRLIAAVARLDYPRDRLEIQVLDDSTDETRAIIARQVRRLAAAGIDIRHLHRGDRKGFKAGALAAGLTGATGELIAVFDADFVPPPDFLRRTVPHFHDPRLGMVQARWEHLNRSYNLLTRIQAIFLDGHFLIEHAARHRSGCFFNFNGTAGVWRRRAIEDAGGWQHDTVTEDLDLSYRAQLQGWRFLFLPEVTVPAELPAEVNGFKRQQARWAKGSLQTARKLLGRILAAPLPGRIKLEAAIHLTNNASYPLMVVLSALLFPAMLLRREGGLAAVVLVDAPLFVTATGSVLLFYLVSQAAAGRRWWRELAVLPPLMAAGIGLAISNGRAVVSGCVARGGVFERTPKFRIEGRGGSWRGKRYRTPAGSALLLEGAFAAWFLAAFAAACRLEMWLSLPFLYLFLQGYAAMFAWGVLSGLPSRRSPRRRAAERRPAPTDPTRAARPGLVVPPAASESHG
jgi:cellulose synthase/poly-beta-1,6-N-acetylglucosamine synthase-like glycosyltransferase